MPLHNSISSIQFHTVARLSTHRCQMLCFAVVKLIPCCFPWILPIHHGDKTSHLWHYRACYESAYAIPDIINLEKREKISPKTRENIIFVWLKWEPEEAYLTHRGRDKMWHFAEENFKCNFLYWSIFIMLGIEQATSRYQKIIMVHFLAHICVTRTRLQPAIKPFNSFCYKCCFLFNDTVGINVSPRGGLFYGCRSRCLELQWSQTQALGDLLALEANLWGQTGTGLGTTLAKYIRYLAISSK